ncbi:MAG: ribose 5-phosphate isomerase B [Candidatus Omnitrophica bacterium]|nr:ribose 5-phosphate isomerase B [Candidatus Omnitrophota bacterium]
MKKVALGADHGGFFLKGEIRKALLSKGYQALDLGTNTQDPCDYPLYAYKVAKAVSERKADFGILICRSGNGMAIVANKLPRVRAAICYDRNVARLSRQHNDANILVLGSEHLFDEPESIVREWLEASFEGGRHKRRVDQITKVEREVRALPDRVRRRSLPDRVRRRFLAERSRTK